MQFYWGLHLGATRPHDSSPKWRPLDGLFSRCIVLTLSAYTANLASFLVVTLGRFSDSVVRTKSDPDLWENSFVRCF